MLTLVIFLWSQVIFASFILIPMDDVTQTNHLKAYGITYWTLEKGNTAKWLLNYEGGSFLLEGVINESISASGKFALPALM